MNQSADTSLSKWPFILRYGVIGWGLPVAALYLLIDHFLLRNDTPLLKVVVFAVAFMLTGILFGLWMWRVRMAREGRG